MSYLDVAIAAALVAGPNASTLRRDASAAAPHSSAANTPAPAAAEDAPPPAKTLKIAV
jgi:hypothetical protein